MIKKHKFLGGMFGLAIGDALGFPTEFMSLEDIYKEFGPEGITDFESTGRNKRLYGMPSLPGTYSDDTQLSLATANALINSKSDSLENIMAELRKEYIKWSISPENNRAAGETTMSGIDNMNAGIPWRESGIRDSRGCGAAMRTAPIGLFFNKDLKRLEEAAYAASVCTHAHPTDVASGIATAYLVSLATNNENPRNYIENLIGIGKKYDDRFVKKIRQIKKVLDYTNPQDSMRELGEGWIGDEAVALALFCFLKNPNDYRKTVLMAANTSGDSDSIACIAGAISGAYNGIDSIPYKWIKKVETPDLIKETADKLYRTYLGLSSKY